MQNGRNSFARLGLALALLTGLAAKARAESIVSNELPSDTLIVMQRGACERHCPVYKLILFADGSVIFDGRAWVRKAGLAKLKISLESIKALVDEAEGFGFLAMKPRYDAEAGCEIARTDAPAIVLTLSTKGRSHTVTHFLGCAGAEPERLKQWETNIDATAGVANGLK